MKDQQHTSMKRVRLAVVLPFILGIFIGTMITVFLSTTIQSIDDDDDSDILVNIQGKVMSMEHSDIQDLHKDHKRKVSPSRIVSYNVLVSKGELLRRASAIHKTWASGGLSSSNAKGKVMFYVEPKDQNKLYPVQLKKQTRKMSVVNISTIGQDQNWNPVIDGPVFKIWRDICQQKLERNLWFASVRDDTYLRKEKLEKLLLSLNSSEAIFLGKPIRPSGTIREDLGLREGENYCHKSCYVLSWKAMELVCPMLMSCQERARSTDGDVELARCVRIHAGVSCTGASEVRIITTSSFKTHTLLYTTIILSCNQDVKFC